MNCTLTILDVSGVQKYLFHSNRMAHNIGASYLVEQATDTWVQEAARELKSGEIPQDGVDYELIYHGGGNAVLLFASRERAQSFMRVYSRHLLRNAPGLRVAVQHCDFDWDADALSEIYSQTLVELAKKKAAQTAVMPMLGMSVTAACQYTGLPAVDWETDPAGERRRVSAQTLAKVNAYEKARKELKDHFSDLLNGYDFVYDFEGFGEPGEASYLAVVHADGNEMGKRKEKICARFPDAKDNRKFIKAMSTFSEEVKKASLNALRATFAWAMEWDARKEVMIDAAKGRVRFVPLVYGGDDVTFVCDGRIGLSLAAIFLQEFQKQRADEQLLNACAGIAIVKKRYPFAHAYEMVDKLCKNAKSAVRKLKESGSPDASALDWHFAVSGAVLNVQEIRAREYTVSNDQKEGKLYIRPLMMDGAGEPLKRWTSFPKVVNAFKYEKSWGEARNKVKELREQLRRGPSATKQFRELYDLKELPVIADVSDGRTNGWVGDECAYFDAIEIMDLFQDVETPQKDEEE